MIKFCAIVFQPKQAQHGQDLRVTLAEFILNFEFPRDVYMILITIITLYLILKLFRFSIRLITSLIRPIIFIVLILVSFHIFNFKWICILCAHEMFETANFSLNMRFSGHFAISLRDENKHYIKSCDYQCIFAERRTLPWCLQYFKLNLHAHHSILCEKLLITHRTDEWIQYFFFSKCSKERMFRGAILKLKFCIDIIVTS